MGKLKRYLETGVVYFVTTNTYKRKEIFNNVQVSRFLLFCVGYHKFMLNFNLFGYVIMPDHIHLLIQPSKKYDLSSIMKSIKGNFARKYNEWTKVSSMLDKSDGNRHLSADYRQGLKGNVYKPVWQEGFYDTGLRDEKQILGWLEYIHWNPVKKGIVEHQKNYEFSSYHQYFGAKRNKVQLPLETIL